MPHIFELFVQADHASTKAQAGLGIGSTPARNQVEMHQGVVEARGAGLGCGNEFTVRLPFLSQPRNIPSEPQVGKPVKIVSGHRVLVVDDNRDAALSLSLLLRYEGHEVQVAHDGQSALQLAETFRPAIIFLDIGMPGNLVKPPDQKVIEGFLAELPAEDSRRDKHTRS
ncbi:MAG TPA: response regulator [Planctomycetaceae bacterium]|nr:response regulator [Planctomycetaceae bacterium]